MPENSTKRRASGTIVTGLTIGTILLTVWALDGQLKARKIPYSNIEICDAIYRAEGGAKARYWYSIKSVKYKDISEAQRICLNTVKSARGRYKKLWWKGDFISFLGKTYCPVDTGRWVKNVKWFIQNKGR